MTDLDIIKKHFNSDRIDFILGAIYKNAGVQVGGYGFISGGFGGGIDMEQAHHLMWINGYFDGLFKCDEEKGIELVEAIGNEIKSRWSDVPDDFFRK